MASTGNITIGTGIITGDTTGNIIVGNLKVNGNANISGTANIGNISMASTGNITIGSVAISGNGNIVAGNANIGTVAISGNGSPNPLIIDPSLNFFYTFNNSDLLGNVLKNQGISQAFDLTINEGVVDGQFTGDPLLGTISSSLTLTSAGYSVGCWFSFKETTPNDILFSFSRDNTTQNNIMYFYIPTISGNPTFSIRDSVNGANGGNNSIFNNLVANQLYHVVYVNRGTEWDVYKDGVFLITLTGKTAAISEAKTFNFVGKQALGSNKFNGMIDGLFVYQGQLTAAQILEIYSKGLKPSQSDYYYTIPIQPYTYTYANNSLSYYFDFNARPPHPYGGNRYKVYSSFISFGTPTNILRTNQMSYYVIEGLGYVNTLIGRGLTNPTFQMKNNHLIKNITLKRSVNFVGASQFNQKWIDLDPTMPMIIENINDTGVLTVEIRLIHNNNLSSNVASWGAQAFSYIIQLLFEPIED